MALKTWPSDIELRNERWTQVQPQQVNRSGWTGRTQIAELSAAARWTMEGDLPPMTRANALAWRGFAMSLQGRTHTFRKVVGEQEQHAAGIMTVTVSGAGQTGTSLIVATTAASTNLLSPGMFVTIGLPSGDEQLIGVPSGFTSNPDGFGTLVLATPLRESPANGAVIETRFPYALMRAVDPVAWSVEPGPIYGHTFVAEEAF